MPRKTTNASKLARGTSRPDRQSPDPSLTRLERLPRVPSRLDPDARAQWKKLGAACIARGTLAAGDLEALARAAEASSLAARLVREAADANTFSLGASGQRVVNPVFSQARQWSAEARSWLSVLGLTPASRPAVEKVPEPVETSDFDRFIDGGRIPRGTHD